MLRILVDDICVGCMSFGIEFGFIWIKVCLIGGDVIEVFVMGFFFWENWFEDGFWIYVFDDVWMGICLVYVVLIDDVD